jgi:hypothetical protein
VSTERSILLLAQKLTINLEINRIEAMKRVVILTFICLTLSGFSQPESSNVEEYLLGTTPVSKGEELEFKLSYGWFTLGKASLTISDDYHVLRDRECYKVEVQGQTAGLLGAFSKVDDYWKSYVTKEELIPLESHSDLQEGRYMRKEKVIFDQDRGTITVDMIKRNKKRPIKVYEAEGVIHDLLSGYVNMRTINYNSLAEGHTVRFKAFYDEVFYDFGFVYDGREMVDTEVGELIAHKIIPLLPENDIFPGENPITTWISADLNQLPLLIRAKMFFGTAYVELTNYKNIKYGPDFQD